MDKTKTCFAFNSAQRNIIRELKMLDYFFEHYRVSSENEQKLTFDFLEAALT